MKHYLKPVLALASLVIFITTSVQADTQEKMVIALKTNDFELTETDISTLAIGEAQTIETESGRVIDILRTAEGAEIYVDGELLEMNTDADGPDEKHRVEKQVTVVCEEAGTSCSEHVVWNSDGEEIDLEELHEMHGNQDMTEPEKAHKVIVIKKQIVSED